MANHSSVFKAVLGTIGRKTSAIHKVMLLAVMYDKKIYFSRHRPDSDWFKNVLANPKVTVQYNTRTYHGTARLVKDEEVARTISRLKYPGEDRADEKRVVIEVTPDGL